jgi:predicted phosphoadenosine phosphosulfate sulfurtransferase
MPAMTALDINVYDAALDRVRIVYDVSDDVIVSMSGGKDSTVLLHLALVVAAERGKLPVKVYWLDQEAEWIATVEYMHGIMNLPEVEPHWFQFPFRLTNSMSHEDSYLHCWDPAERQSWLHEQDPLSIKENPLAPNDRFHYLVKNLPSVCCAKDKERVGVLVGVRMAESQARRFLIWSGPSWQGIKWCHRKTIRNTRTFWPIYDWEDSDVFACLAKNDLAYNTIYDTFYRFGVSGRAMRVSALIHETSWHAMRLLQVAEPETLQPLSRPGAGGQHIRPHDR